MLTAVAVAAIVQNQSRKPSITGTVKVYENFESKFLANKRTVSVYTPPQYDAQPNRRYPVLYMHDGQNVFDGMRSFIPNQEWRVDDAIQAMSEAGLLEPMIVVAVDNAGIQRADEYLPTQRTDNNRKWGGNSAKYGRMMVEELKPFIDKTYRTKSDAMNTALCGSSFGGIATLELGLTYPSVFGKLGIVSPSVWWDDRVVLKHVDAIKRKTSQRIWIDIGTSEGKDSVTDAQMLAKAFEKKGWKAGKDLVLYVDGFSEHNEAAWARRFPTLISFLFPRP